MIKRVSDILNTRNYPIRVEGEIACFNYIEERNGMRQRHKARVSNDIWCDEQPIEADYDKLYGGGVCMERLIPLEFYYRQGDFRYRLLKDEKDYVFTAVLIRLLVDSLHATSPIMVGVKEDDKFFRIRAYVHIEEKIVREV